MSMRGNVFRYESFQIDSAAGQVICRYGMDGGPSDGRKFTERITLVPAGHWDSPAATAAARLIFLLAGVSYYKTAAPPVVELGEFALTAVERSFLREFYLSGLGEFAYRNGIDLSDLRITAPDRAGGPLAPSDRADGPLAPKGEGGTGPRALVPFGGGIDSIVTVERVRRRADAALFVVSRPGDRFAAIERPAVVTGLPVVRAEREIDPQLLRSKEHGFLNGHVPVTGILSAIAVLAAVLDDRDAVVMSNEWSSSVPTLQDERGRPVNHQYSKSDSFEAGFRDVLGQAGPAMPDYFSMLRPRSELWVAEQFAKLESYHSSFRSCNRAFHIDTALRLDYWCGRCDKCCFIDLILAPFMDAADLRRVFAGREPLDDVEQAGRFRALLGTSVGTKPFECVGEVTECRAAALLAAGRPDRADCKLLGELASEVEALPDAPSRDAMDELLRPIGMDWIPAGYR
jgi:hypothetical protein